MPPSVPSSRVTIHDVARHAGVSHQTVSRVMNEHPSVAPSTRQKVQQAIHTLHYQPNLAARTLVTQRTSTLGIVGFGLLYYGPAQMMLNIEQAARNRGYSVTLASIPELREAEIERALLDLRRQNVDGIIMITPLKGVDTDRIRAVCGAIPFVLVDAPDAGSLSGATIDQKAGGHLAAQHLIALGHERIALLCGPQRWHDARLRLDGWTEALNEAGLRPVTVLEGDWTAASGFGLTQELLAARTSFTGLLVGNDQMALGALWALHERGVSVPRDVSIVGFDDIPESRFFHPPLTTVRQDFATLGALSLATLLEAIESPDTTPQPHVLKPEILIRASTTTPTPSP
ncbi:substrate-binding domain-containing protein (plasmid) [Deinococcus taeanensis]|uniref:LacI family DNA-binding transcriptional regulator n=1 Tax=Deinococcus taeanensis TaxID=2737050 RepID=UPI001CDD7951|nr:LacI family DNA-binding transcriptional regulator [Deinococcus taeanensis]UBV45086.1 substrate-binding domain-containing protein [Deinococcus taeanensis]